MNQVVDCQMHGYQLSEEALLKGEFIGNILGGGIRDTLTCTQTKHAERQAADATNATIHHG